MDKAGWQTEGFWVAKCYLMHNHILYHNQVHCNTTGGNIIGIIVLMQEGQTR
jgi:hypothetical protein